MDTLTPHAPVQAAVQAVVRRGRWSPRGWIRDAVVVVAIVVTAPWWLATWLEKRTTGRERVLQSCGEFFSLFPGLLGVFLRRGYYAMTLDRFAWDCGLGFGTTFAHRQAEVGRGVSVGNRVTIGKCVLEDDVLIGSNVDILSGRRQHDFDDGATPVQFQPRRFTAVRIGRNTWLGNSSVIMADVGEECVIGAGSVVVRPIPPRCVAVGNPATVKKQAKHQRPAAEDDK